MLIYYIQYTVYTVYLDAYYVLYTPPDINTEYIRLYRNVFFSITFLCLALINDKLYEKSESRKKN